MKTLTREDIRFSLELMGIRPGDVLLVHSALSSIGYVEGGADSVIDAFCDAVGPEGHRFHFLDSVHAGLPGGYGNPDADRSGLGRNQ